MCLGKEAVEGAYLHAALIQVLFKLIQVDSSAHQVAGREGGVFQASTVTQVLSRSFLRYQGSVLTCMDDVQHREKHVQNFRACT